MNDLVVTAGPDASVKLADPAGFNLFPSDIPLSVSKGATFDLFVEGAMQAVPEPSTWAMMAIGFAGLGFFGCRRARASHSPRAA